MDPCHLRTDELTYELLIRNIDPSGNADRKRRVLRGALAQVDANRSNIEFLLR